MTQDQEPKNAATEPALHEARFCGGVGMNDQPTGTAATTPGEASEIRPRIASPGQRLCEYGCGYPARFHVGDNTEQYGNDSCARHLAFYVERMGGPAETDWVPVAPIDGGR